MRDLHIYMPDEMFERLNKAKDKAETNKSELVKNLIRKYLEDNGF